MILPLRTASPPSVSDLPAERQAGAIPYSWVDDHLTYLLITSRGTGKWLFPKGALVEKIHPREIALNEAREEAGVTGTIDHEPFGTYRDWKTRDVDQICIEVLMYPLRVEEQLDEWQESEQRYRHWAAFPELNERLNNPHLMELVTRFNDTLIEMRA